MWTSQIHRTLGVLLAVLISAATSATAAEDATEEVQAGPLTFQIPESWKNEEPSNRLRLAQFSIPAAEDDLENAELVISGPFGGSVDANIQRWLGQFAAEGREVQMTQAETAQGKYILVELSGTYNKPIGPPIRRQSKAMPGYRVINVMLMSEEGGNFFFKLAGPDATVKAAAKAFRASFGADASQEEEFKLD